MWVKILLSNEKFKTKKSGPIDYCETEKLMFKEVILKLLCI